jgi:hypothetical protein
MKKFIILVSLLIINLFSFGQSYYKATMTEMYTYNRNSEEWELYQKNSDTKITVVIEDKFISFQAKTPSMYRIFEGTKEPIKTKSLTGYRYQAKDLKEEKLVKIDVVMSEETKLVIVSIINFDEGYNFRFYLTEIID